MPSNNVSDSPVVTLRIGLLSLLAILMSALIIMIVRTNRSTPEPCRAEFVPLAQLQACTAVSLSADTLLPDTLTLRDKSNYPDNAKHVRRSKPASSKDVSAAQPIRQITGETLNP